MRDWTTMSAGDWNTDGVQLDLLAGIEGDGYGTIALDEITDEQAPAAEVQERGDGALFGIIPGILGEPDTVEGIGVIETYGSSTYRVTVDDDGLATYKPLAGMWR